MTQADSEKSKSLILEQHFIPSLQNLYQKYESILLTCFAKDKYFSNSFRMAYTQFINRSIEDRCMGEVLAASTEKVLKKGQGRVSEGEIREFIMFIT